MCAVSRERFSNGAQCLTLMRLVLCDGQKMLKLFHEFDQNKNGMLDSEEIAALNVHIFWDVPRIGSKDISESVAFCTCTTGCIYLCE